MEHIENKLHKECLKNHTEFISKLIKREGYNPANSSIDGLLTSFYNVVMEHKTDKTLCLTCDAKLTELPDETTRDKFIFDSRPPST